MFYVYIVPCSSPTDPANGTITCLLGDDGVPSYEDICRVTCNNGDTLTRTCQSDGSWNSTEIVCERGALCICVIVTVVPPLWSHQLSGHPVIQIPTVELGDNLDKMII